MFRYLISLVALFAVSLSSSVFGQTTVQNVWQAPEGTPAAHSAFVYIPGLDIDMYNVNQAKPTLELVPYLGSAKSGNWKMKLGLVGAVGDNKAQWWGGLMNVSGKISDINVALPVYALRDNTGKEYAFCPCIRVYKPVYKTASAGIGGKFNFGSGNRTLKLGPLYQQKVGRNAEFRFRYIFPISGGGKPEVRGDLLLFNLR